MENIGIQLYSYPSSMTFEEKLAHAAASGYAGVEFAGDYGGLAAPEMKAVLKKYGLWAKTAHVHIDRIGPELPYLAEIGVKHIIFPYKFFRSMEAVHYATTRLNELGKISAAYGIKVGFHNHMDEFYPMEGKRILDHLMADTDPETVSFQLDCGWATCAGACAQDVIREYAGRFSAIHIKENTGVAPLCAPHAKDTPYVALDGHVLSDEEAADRERIVRAANCKMGEGNVNWRAVVDAVRAQCDDPTFIVERENAYGDLSKPECVAEDVAWLKANL